MLAHISRLETYKQAVELLEKELAQQRADLTYNARLQTYVRVLKFIDSKNAFSEVEDSQLSDSAKRLLAQQREEYAGIAKYEMELTASSGAIKNLNDALEAWRSNDQRLMITARENLCSAMRDNLKKIGNT